MRRLIVFLALSFGLLFCMSTHANAMMAMKSCTVTLPNITLSSVDVLPGTAVTTSGSIALSCSNFPSNENDRFCLSVGSGAGFTGSQRQLVNGANKLNYDVYQDSGYSTLWGSWVTGFDTSGLSIQFTATGTTVSQSIPVYVKIFASQSTVVPGTYSSAFPNSTSGLHDQSGPTGGACPTGAETANAGFTIQATVIPNCDVSATTMDFGTATFLNSTINATSTITAKCTNTTPYNVGLNAGTTTGGTTTTRLMTAGGANTIAYKIYSDTGHTTNWGNNVGTDTISGTGTGGNQTLTAYGQILAQTSVAPTTYNDTVTVTVTY